MDFTQPVCNISGNASSVMVRHRCRLVMDDTDDYLVLGVDGLGFCGADAGARCHGLDGGFLPRQFIRGSLGMFGLASPAPLLVAVVMNDAPAQY